jgi:hypothetical protein
MFRFTRASLFDASPSCRPRAIRVDPPVLLLRRLQRRDRGDRGCLHGCLPVPGFFLSRGRAYGNASNLWECAKAGTGAQRRSRHRKEWAGQWEVVPTHAPTGIGDHVERRMQRREGVNGGLALARRHLPTSVEERARRNDHPRPRAFRADNARGRRNATLFLRLRGLRSRWRRSLLDGEALVERGGGFVGVLREGAERDRQHQRKRRARQDAIMTRSTHEALA